MEEDQDNLDHHLLPGLEPGPLPEEEDMDLDMDLGAEGKAGVAMPNQGDKHPMDYQQAELPEERAGQDEALERPRPNTRSQARANHEGLPFNLTP